MQNATVTVRKKNKLTAKNISRIEQKERTRFWRDVQKQENGCWVWTGTKRETGKCFFYRSLFAGVVLSSAEGAGRQVKTPPHFYAKKLSGALIEKVAVAKDIHGHNRRFANLYCLKNGNEIISSLQTCKTHSCCNPDHFKYETQEQLWDANQNKLQHVAHVVNENELTDEAEQQRIAKIESAKAVGFRHIGVIEYDIQCLKANATQININGEYFYPESLQNLYEEAINELKELLEHSYSLGRNADAREEIYHKLHQCIVDGLNQYNEDYNALP